MSNATAPAAPKTTKRADAIEIGDRVYLGPVTIVVVDDLAHIGQEVHLRDDEIGTYVLRCNTVVEGSWKADR